MNGTERVLGLIEIVERLAALLLKENKALAEKRSNDALQYLDEKNDLTRIYESRVKGLPREPEAIEEVPLELREKLRQLGEKVDLIVEENGHLLEITIAANRRIVQLVADAVKAQRQGLGTYSANGVADGGKLSSGPRNLPLSVNQTL